SVTRVSVAVTVPPLGRIRMPAPVEPCPLLEIRVSLTTSLDDAAVATMMPVPPAEVKFLITQFDTLRDPPARNLIPLSPGEGPAPSMTRPRRLTMSDGPALMMMPFVPDARTPASPEPPSLVREIDLVIVTAPKPPGSSTLISPPAAVLEIAPAKVLQGAVRLHGFTSSPTPDTNVRVA